MWEIQQNLIYVFIVCPQQVGKRRETTEEFYQFIFDQHCKRQFQPEFIGNMHETTVLFSIPPDDDKGMVDSKADTELGVSVMLTCTADGSMLTLANILEGKKEVDVKCPPGWIACTKRGGRMDGELFNRCASTSIDR